MFQNTMVSTLKHTLKKTPQQNKFLISRVSLLGCVLKSYWIKSDDCENGGLAIKIYLAGTIALICINMILLVALVNRSAQGSMTETQKRLAVSPLLVCK